MYTTITIDKDPDIYARETSIWLEKDNNTIHLIFPDAETMERIAASSTILAKALREGGEMKRLDRKALAIRKV